MIVIEAQLVAATQQKKEIDADLVGKRIRFQQVKKKKLKTFPGEGHKQSVEVIVSLDKAFIRKGGNKDRMQQTKLKRASCYGVSLNI